MQRNREPVSESLVNETIDEARSLLTQHDLASVGDLEESLFDMSFSTVKKPEKSPDQKYRLY